MTVFSQLPLQSAVYLNLSGDGALMAQVTGIYDRPPQGSLYPYITLGDSTANDWSTKTTKGTEQIFSLHVWSREGGHKQAAQIMERIYQLLHEANLSIAGHALVSLRLTASLLEQENDGWTYHGRMQFRALLEATA